MSQKPPINFVALQKNIQDSLKKPQAKEACLSFQQYPSIKYSKLLLLYSSQFGIYIMPQLDTLQVWHGILFVRYGLFKDAKFKFKISFKQFPRLPPEVFFINQIYHPMINIQTGLLDLGQQMTKNWNYGGQHLIFTVIQHIRLVFIDVKKYQATDSYNKKAGQLFKSNVDEFFIKVRQSVQTSKGQIYNNYADTSLKFVPFNQRHKKLKESLSQICQDQNLSQQQKKRKFMKMLKQ